jgi:hypothetical protein
MKIQILKTRLSTDEKETHYLINANNDDVVIMETTIMKDFNRAKKQGWNLVELYKYEDGDIAGGVFEAPRRCLSIRNTKEKELSERQLENLEKMRNARRNGDNK